MEPEPTAALAEPFLPMWDSPFRYALPHDAMRERGTLSGNAHMRYEPFMERRPRAARFLRRHPLTPDGPLRNCRRPADFRVTSERFAPRSEQSRIDTQGFYSNPPRNAIRLAVRRRLDAQTPQERAFSTPRRTETGESALIKAHTSQRSTVGTPKRIRSECSGSSDCA